MSKTEARGGRSRETNSLTARDMTAWLRCPTSVALDLILRFSLRHVYLG